jgi:hypothetical protein
MARDESIDLTLEIDENGEVSSSSRATRRRLAGASGRWRLLPVAGDLLIWQRDASETSERARVMLAGEIDGSGTLVNIINFIHFAQWDGALSIVFGGVRKTLQFRRGALLAAASNLPEERLGALLVRFGHITDEDLVVAVREVTPQRKLGLVLVERGLMTTHLLYEAVRRQCEEIFYSVLLVRTGAFYFSKQSDDAQMSTRLHLDTQSLLLEGLRRIDEMSYFREKIPSGKTVLAKRTPAPAEEPKGAAKTVYALVDGERSIDVIARDSHLGEFAATKAAFELVQTGHVTIHDAQDLRRDAVPDAALPADSAGAIIDAYNGAFARLWGALSNKGKLATIRESVGTFLGGSIRFAELLRDVHVGDDGKLPRRQLLLNVDGLPEGERLSLLQSALNELLMFALFVAGDAIDRGEEQELHERVARALEGLPRAISAPR